MQEKSKGYIKMRRVGSMVATGEVSTHYYIDTNPDNPSSKKYRIMGMELDNPLQGSADANIRTAALNECVARFLIAENVDVPLDTDNFYAGWVQYKTLHVLPKGQEEYRGMGR